MPFCSCRFAEGNDHPVERARHRAFSSRVEIEGSRLKIGVPELFLDHLHVHPVAEESAGVGMPQRVLPPGEAGEQLKGRGFKRGEALRNVVVF